MFALAIARFSKAPWTRTAILPAYRYMERYADENLHFFAGPAYTPRRAAGGHGLSSLALPRLLPRSGVDATAAARLA